jgi:hypothetical protein
LRWQAAFQGIGSAQTPQSFSAWTITPLRSGGNDIDLDGDGRADVVFVALRGPAWELVPFDGPGINSQPTSPQPLRYDHD